MKLIIYYYICKACGTEFKSPEVNNYGEFLLRSENGELAYLNAIEDRVFNTISKILKLTPKYKGNEIDKVKILHKNFGFTCDRAKDGTFFQITNNPKCPNCNCSEYSSYGVTSPPENVNLDLEKVTHNFWESLSPVLRNKIAQAIVVNDSEEAHRLLNR
jgi:hypothetical protein